MLASHISVPTLLRRALDRWIRAFAPRPSSYPETLYTTLERTIGGASPVAQLRPTEFRPSRS